MEAPGSVTVWISELKAGNAIAAERIWQGYFERLVHLARARLLGRPRAAADEEDAALSAFDSFCCGVAAGKFPRLLDRDDLWQLLVVITARKAYRLIRDERRHKRGGGAVQHLSALGEDVALGEIIGREPTPDFAAQVAEECQRRLEQLGEPKLRAIVLAKMEGRTNAEVAALLGVVERTVERRLQLVRNLWGEEGDGP
jgi:DNA-directed RNA polymerase specialized sigma24 family protein